MTPIDHGRLEEKTEDRVEEGEKQGRPSWRVAHLPVLVSDRHCVGSFLTAQAYCANVARQLPVAP